jgi:hypothetical protein
MKTSIAIFIFIIILATAEILLADCPFDHLIIGCNQDGILGTEDDTKIFVDCRQKYRNSGIPAYCNWYYPLHESIFSEFPYRRSEPGFDSFQNYNPTEDHTYDPNRSLNLATEEKHRIVIECISISPGLRVVHGDYPQFEIVQAGDCLDYTVICEPRDDWHIHLSYQALDGENLYWVIYKIFDTSEKEDKYESSEPFTIVFNKEPLRGDFVVDRTVDVGDLIMLSNCWLFQNGSIENDFYERIDANQDSVVDFSDVALLASNWRHASDR